PAARADASATASAAATTASALVVLGGFLGGLARGFFCRLACGLLGGLANALALFVVSDSARRFVFQSSQLCFERAEVLGLLGERRLSRCSGLLRGDHLLFGDLLQT